MSAFPPRSAVVNLPCPLLPAVTELHDHSLTRRHGEDKGPAFYVDALRYAQSQWMAGKPAQAVLQLDKAWMADLARDSAVLVDHPSPYAALVWILRRSVAGDCGFLGNPVRHFQHLASRMSGPRAGIRTWRAWCGLHLAERALPASAFPRDGRQIAREGLWIPGFETAVAAIARSGWPGEAAAARAALDGFSLRRG